MKINRLKLITIASILILVIGIFSLLLYTNITVKNNCNVVSQKLDDKFVGKYMDERSGILYIGDICFENELYYIYKDHYSDGRGYFHLLVINKDLKWYMFFNEEHPFREPNEYKNDKIHFGGDNSYTWDIREQLESFEELIKKYPERYEIANYGDQLNKWGWNKWGWCGIKVTRVPPLEKRRMDTGINCSYSIEEFK